ncbi:MocR-like pyridoxine biosynthesis transcription factor PdxR [Delftia acidovorans]|uniref:PLP-dependent aminotransferase family protein n=1 Tax=Delftia acidovorans TaxID=80866 RepID=A0AAJ2R664_DELAC|nr:PLP-dependent aminotransferase family protein [Delftia acidovorans]MDX4956546.1 PLP-dependent aminotransferase family protein [Delftia acidovorans]
MKEQLSLSLSLDRASKISLSEQIRQGIERAIEQGVLKAGARLPSWLDLASQLGVSRGTVKAAYERLVDGQLVVSSRAAGTRVAERPLRAVIREERPDEGSFTQLHQEMIAGQGIFQLGIPAKDSLPSKVFARIRARSVRMETTGWPTYPDPRGELDLRQEIAGYLAISRGIDCTPAQIIITSGFAGGLGLVLRALALEGTFGWFENPGFPFSRRALEISRIQLVPVPVDDEGIVVDYGIRHAKQATLALVTPGQHAPLGATMSLRRRLQLIEWAAESKTWVIEDDYLGELQLDGRAAPALMSLDRSGRVIHLGSFSKTISPKLRIGFAVIPAQEVHRFAEVAATLAPAPAPSIQAAISEFMRDGLYIRHLRRTRRLLISQRDVLVECLSRRGINAKIAGLSALIELQQGVSDIAICRESAVFGLSPGPLSPWYADSSQAPAKLLLGIATAPISSVDQACDRLAHIIHRHTASAAR